MRKLTFVLNSIQETYDKDGNFLIEVSEYGDKYKGEVKYNDKNLPIYLKGGILSYNTDPGLSSYFDDGEQYMEYEYDDKGNWVRQTVYVGEMKEPYQISERTIVY